MCLRRRRRDKRNMMNAATKNENKRKPGTLNRWWRSAWSVWLRATRILKVKEGGGRGSGRNVLVRMREIMPAEENEKR